MLELVICGRSVEIVLAASLPHGGFCARLAMVPAITTTIKTPK